MGWNDHVIFAEMECFDCGEIDTWEFWDNVAKVRYGGALGEKLGHDVRKSGCCPHCGSTKGQTEAEAARGKPLAMRIGKVLDGEHIDDVIAALGYVCGISLAPLPDELFEQWVAGVRTIKGKCK